MAGAHGGVIGGIARAANAKTKHAHVVRIYQSVRETRDEREAVSVTRGRLANLGMEMTDQHIRNVLDRAGVKPKKKRN